MSAVLPATTPPVATTAPPRPASGRRIGLLVKMFPKLSETFVLEEVLGLERLGVPLVIYTLAKGSDEVAHDAVQRVQSPVQPVPQAPWRQPLALAACHLRLAAAAPWRYARALQLALTRGRQGLVDLARAAWLADRLRRDGVGHLHTHFISQPADLAELVSEVSGTPFSISAHAKDIYLGDPVALRRKMAAARFTVTCTDFNCSTLRRIAPDAAVHRMYHGIDGAVFSPTHRATPSLVPLILSVGRLREKKGLDTLIQACRLLTDRGVTYRCEIVGYGEEHERLQALIDDSGLADQVQLTGKLTRPHVIDRYARAAVYVQPSRVAADGDRDGIPNVLLEALAMGVPAVATRVSGIPEVVKHRRNGLLVQPDDVAELADSIECLLNAPALAAQLARAGRRTVTEHFDNDRNLRVVLQLLEHSHETDTRRAVS